MRATEFITEAPNHPVICIDVQPEYSGIHDGAEDPVFEDIIKFVANQTGPVLMFVNAEDTGVSGDTKQDIVQYWEDTLCGDPEDRYIEDEYGDWIEEECDAINWLRFEIVDKGYGYLRSWMDQNVNDATIIQTIREMYRQKVADSRELFGGEGTEEYEQGMQQLGIPEHLYHGDMIAVEWTSIAQLRKYNGAYMVGGGRNECLREVQLLMSAFNIKYKEIDELIYG